MFNYKYVKSKKKKIYHPSLNSSMDKPCLGSELTPLPLNSIFHDIERCKIIDSSETTYSVSWGRGIR